MDEMDMQKKEERQEIIFVVSHALISTISDVTLGVTYREK